MMNFKEEAAKLEPYIIDTRRKLHMNPELSFEETQTTAFIAQELKKCGLDPHTYPDYNGVWTVIEGTKAFFGKRRTVALRADIDALPVEECTGLPFSSKNPGVMHACGHDNHTAMLLGAARILNAHREELCGNVKLIFQSAEESCRGAAYYVEHGFLDDVDAIFGMHVWATLEDGKIDAAAGARMASVDNFSIKVRGISAHGSAPFEGRDAITAAAAIIMNVQMIVSRFNDPRNSLVITIGEITGGQRFNIIAGEVEMKGTVRTHSSVTRMQVEGWLRSMVENTAAACGVEAELTYEYCAGPCTNDPTLSDIAKKAISEIAGPDVLVDQPPAMGSEDFAYYTDGTGVPGMYVFSWNI